jgi:amidase
MKRRTQQIGRRRFLKAVPATVAAGVALPGIAPSTVSAQRGGATPARPEPVEGRVRTDALKGAEQIAGLRFTDAEEEAALNGVSRNLDAYERLRKLDIPLDTEPAITFRPGKRHETPGAPPPGPGRSSRNAKLAIAKPARVQVNGNLEALAFEPVTALASLIESRKISSTDLTKMYLARLKRYGEPLHCVITLTEDLALAQAANADKELKAGRYRGPLHGIPWGAKDLLATKGIRTTWGAKPYENQVAHDESDSRRKPAEDDNAGSRRELRSEKSELRTVVTSRLSLFGRSPAWGIPCSNRRSPRPECCPGSAARRTGS